MSENNKTSGLTLATCSLPVSSAEDLLNRWDSAAAAYSKGNDTSQRISAAIALCAEDFRRLLLHGPQPAENKTLANSPPESRLVLQRRYLPKQHIPTPWTEWHDHPEPYQIAWGLGQYATIEENIKATCRTHHTLGKNCEYRMVRRTDQTIWEYSTPRTIKPDQTIT